MWNFVDILLGHMQEIDDRSVKPYMDDNAQTKNIDSDGRFSSSNDSSVISRSIEPLSGSSCTPDIEMIDLERNILQV
jgi:hypothetical protein